MNCDDARTIISQGLRVHNINSASYKDAKKHLLRCNICRERDLTAFKEIMVGSKLPVDHDYCLESLNEYIDFELRGNLSAKYDRVCNHLAYCKECHTQYLNRYKLAKVAKLVDEIAVAPVPQLNEENPIIKILWDELRGSLRVIQSTIDHVLGEEYVPLPGYAGADIRGFPAQAIVDKEFIEKMDKKDVIRRDFVSFTMELTKAQKARIKVTRINIDIYEISVGIYGMLTNGKALPVANKLVTLSPRDSKGAEIRKTDFSGQANFEKSPGKYTIRIYSSKNVYKSVDLDLMQVS